MIQMHVHVHFGCQQFHRDGRIAKSAMAMGGHESSRDCQIHHYDEYEDTRYYVDEHRDPSRHADLQSQQIHVARRR
jgi:hypothetical protein